MTQGESASWVVEMSIPEQYASIEVPTGIEFVKVSSAALPEEGALYSTDRVPLWLSRYMEIELRAPAGFTLDGPPAVWKEIKLDDPRPYVVWEWLLTAPNQPGTHEILLNVYQAKVAPTNATSGTEVDTRERPFRRGGTRSRWWLTLLRQPRQARHRRQPRPLRRLSRPRRFRQPRRRRQLQPLRRPPRRFRSSTGRECQALF